jgi:hypothetical protein
MRSFVATVSALALAIMVFFIGRVPQVPEYTSTETARTTPRKDSDEYMAAKRPRRGRFHVGIVPEGTAYASGINGSGLGMTGAISSVLPPPGAFYISFDDGQSVSVGSAALDAGGIIDASLSGWGLKQPNYQIFDYGGCYYGFADASPYAPYDAEVTLQPATDPLRYSTTSTNCFNSGNAGPPPDNVDGYEWDSFANFQLRTLLGDAGFIDRPFIRESVGIAGVALTELTPGTPSFAYIDWASTILRRSPYMNPDGGSVIVAYFNMVHGEADCANTSYGPQLYAFFQQVQSVILADTGQTQPILFLVRQQSSTCSGNYQVGVSAQAQAEINQLPNTAMPGGILEWNPEAKGDITDPDHIHPDTQGQQESGERVSLHVSDYFLYLAGRGPYPQGLHPIKLTDGVPDPGTFSRTGNVETIAYTVQHPPLVLDNTPWAGNVYAAHLTGPYAAYFASSYAFECWNGNPIQSFSSATPVAVSSVSITADGQHVQVTCSGSYNTICNGVVADSITLNAEQGGSGPPTGRTVNLRDSDSRLGMFTGQPRYNADAHWCQGGLSVSGGTRGGSALAELGLAVVGAVLRPRRRANRNRDGAAESERAA